MTDVLQEYNTLNAEESDVLGILALAHVFPIDEYSSYRLFGQDWKKGDITFGGFCDLFNAFKEKGLILDEGYRGRVHPMIAHQLAVRVSDRKNPKQERAFQIARQFGSRKAFQIQEKAGLTNAKSALGCALYEETDGDLREILSYTERYEIDLIPHVYDLFGEGISLDFKWFKERPESVQALLCCMKLASSFTFLPKDQEYESFLNHYITHSFESVQHPTLLVLLITLDISLGRLEEAQEKARRFSFETPHSLMVCGSLFFVKGEFSKALQMYQKALKKSKKELQGRGWGFSYYHGVFYSFLLLYYKESVPELRRFLNQFALYNHSHEKFFKLMRGFEFLVGMSISEAKRVVQEEEPSGPFLLYEAMWSFLYALTHDKEEPRLKKWHTRAVEEQQGLARDIFEDLLTGERKSILNFIEIKEVWRETLDQLEKLMVKKDESTAPRSGEERLLWLLDVQRESLKTAIQTYGKKGWSSGSVSKIDRFDQMSLPWLTPQDRAVLEEIEEGYSYSFERERKFVKALTALVGHPNIVHEKDRTCKIQLKLEKPEVLIERTPQGYKVHCSHALPYRHKDFILEEENPCSYKIIPLSDTYRHIADMIPEGGLDFPEQAKEKIVPLIKNAREDVNIYSALDQEELVQKKADSRCVVQLTPSSKDLYVQPWVRPFGDYLYKIGKGRLGKVGVFKGDDGEARQGLLSRSFKEERASFAHIKDFLKPFHVKKNLYKVQREAVLDLLSVLNELKQKNKIHIEWPQDQMVRLRETVTPQKISMRVSSQGNWFEYEGEVQLEGGHVMELSQLLKSLETARGRFIQVSADEFIEMSESLCQKLGLLGKISEKNRVHKLAAHRLDLLSEEGSALEGDQGWTEHIQKIQDMKAHKPKLPRGFKGKLRPYQEAGFRYLSTLAHWGIGSCLADDMGLGKTVQAIALILEYAPKGPTLIIAPTSLCFNWVSELAQFAPSLKVTSLYEGSPVIQGEKKEVVVASYGLLQNREELLTQPWQTVILDEAQAIKNPQTKRWKAIMQLQAPVRVALTGTPLENHLGELWSLFQFINPGLLFSQKVFQEEFAGPIERQKDSEKLKALKELVAPYILRRLKSEVLKELPPKVEKYIYVEPSSKERAFYEVYRKRAQKFLEDTDYNRISFLGHLMKLRQICCDGRIVEENIPLISQKTEAFLELLLELIENGHRVLVFSGFVGYLNKIQEELLKNKITYFYLDGQTPQKTRQTQVEAFQNGEREVFLISLKAGGSGLNLTGADYVIHLDPWWNPAVHDQASDRAHRIGQTKSVTVYKFIVKGSIEEKMVKMHDSKRHLATNLLEGQDFSEKLTEEELKQLITT